LVVRVQLLIDPVDSCQVELLIEISPQQLKMVSVMTNKDRDAVTLYNSQPSSFSFFDLLLYLCDADGLDDIGQRNGWVLDHQGRLNLIKPLTAPLLALVDHLLVAEVAVLHEHSCSLGHSSTAPIPEFPLFLHLDQFDYRDIFNKAVNI